MIRKKEKNLLLFLFAKNSTHNSYIKIERENTMEKEIVKIIGDLAASFEIENKSELGGIVDKAVAELTALGYKMEDPDVFNTFFTFQQNRFMSSVASRFHMKCKNKNNQFKSDFVFTHYQYLKNNIEKLISMRCGSSCIADRSRTIIREYLNWLITEELYEFNLAEEHFWLPKFGTYKDWFSYCDALCDLYYGNPDKYFETYKYLLLSEIRKYKHLEHTWYLKLRDSEPFAFISTYDEDTTNPLLDEYYQYDEAYLIQKQYIPEELRGKFFDLIDGDVELIKKRHYQYIPESEIEKIYFETKDIYV